MSNGPTEEAKRLLPCNCQGFGGTDGAHMGFCSSWYQARVAAALAARDEEIAKLQAKPICAWCETDSDGNHHGVPCPFHRGPERAYELIGNEAAAIERARAELLQEEIAKLNTYIEKISGDNGVLSREREKLKADQQELLQEINFLRQQNQTMQARLKQAETDRESLNEEIAKLKAEVERLQAQAFDAMGELGAFVTMDRDLRAQLAEAEKRNDQLEGCLELSGAAMQEDGSVVVKMAKFNAMHRCAKHRKENYRAQDLERCMVCVQTDLESLKDILAAKEICLMDLHDERDAAEVKGMERAKEIVAGSVFQIGTLIYLPTELVNAIDAEIAKMREGK